MCRAWALDLSSIKPQLDAQGIGLVGVGVEELGVQAFVDGKYFDGGNENSTIKFFFFVFSFNPPTPTVNKNFINSLSANPAKWSSTLKHFVGNRRRIV